MDTKASTSKDPTGKDRKRVDFGETFERNFITHGRAMTEFMLKPSQLEGLPKFNRRSPYESEMFINVYKRKDVEKRAIEVWGSIENLLREKGLHDNKKLITNQNNFEYRKNLRDSRRSRSGDKQAQIFKIRNKCESLMIALALFLDVLNLAFKLVVYLYTSSESILAETIHSAADTLNQSILVYGICQIKQKATMAHPYGYSNMMYVVSLISGVGIFCLGAGISIFTGIMTLTTGPQDLKFEELIWAFLVLGFSAFTDGLCFFCTVFATYRDAKMHDLEFFYYVFRGIEPGLTVILMEDFVAVIGNLIAASMLAVSWKSNSVVADSVGAIVIGLLLGMVALFLIVSNAAALVGRSIKSEKLEEINQVIESDVMIRGIYDVKGIDLGDSLVRYKAEIDFDGAELTRLYLDRIDLNNLLEEVKNIKNIDELENFMVTHGEGIVDLVGGEIDRIEFKIRAYFPEVRHVDLEIL